jgi:hypothetical protein
MAQKFRKIDPRIWRDEKFCTLSEREKVIALYAMTAQANRVGLFTFSPALSAEDLSIEVGTFHKAFENVLETFNWTFDKQFRVLYIPTWWKYNQPENVNVLKGNLKDLHDIPNTPLITHFCNNTKFLERFTDTFIQTLQKRYLKPSAIQEQEQEQEQEPIPNQERRIFIEEDETSIDADTGEVIPAAEVNPFKEDHHA